VHTPDSRDPRPGARGTRIGPPIVAIRLRPVTPADLPAIFEMQSDPESNTMAGTKPRTREVFFAVWQQHFANPLINARVIEIDVGGSGERRSEIVGTLACFQAEGRDCFGYWIARAHWGKGIASRALALFLDEEPRRPLHATAVRTNAPSRRILEKCGFRCVGFHMGEETERFLAMELAEFVLE
jgi:RimJ/RimL family protein N-acetyltransferase